MVSLRAGCSMFALLAVLGCGSSHGAAEQGASGGSSSGGSSGFGGGLNLDVGTRFGVDLPGTLVVACSGEPEGSARSWLTFSVPVTGLAASADYVYAAAGGDLVRVSRSGGCAEPILSTTGEIRALSIQGAQLFFLAVSASGMRIEAVPLTTLDRASRIVSVESASSAGFGELIGDGDALFFNQGLQVMRTTLSGKVELVAESTGLAPLRLALGDDDVYWVGAGRVWVKDIDPPVYTQIFAAPKQGGAARAVSERACMHVAVDGAQLFCVSGPSLPLDQAANSSLAELSEVFADGSSGPTIASGVTALALSPSFVFVGGTLEGVPSLKALARSSTPEFELVATTPASAWPLTTHGDALFFADYVTSAAQVSLRSLEPAR
ncbi:MAG: hypothetical protein QM756_21780 [Polyangiaceae bacterium]